MELICGSDRWPEGSRRALYLALGNFDGVHLGHQVIINNVVRQARDSGGSSAALLLDPHPAMVLWPDRGFALLTDIADRAALMAELGLDYLIVEPFTAGLAALTPEQFVRRVLTGRLRVNGVVIGSDYSFGHRGAGSASTMREFGRRLGFGVEICPLLSGAEGAISSSEIRRLLVEGRVTEAARLLDYYFFRRGKVIRGQGIGKKMVLPTANTVALPHLLWPGSGVYLTAAGSLEVGLRFGVTNVGGKPTFRREAMGVETHIFDFDGDLYHREVTLHFLEKLRDTQTFSGAEQLKKQILSDIEKSRQLIADHYANLLIDKKYFGKTPESDPRLLELNTARVLTFKR